MEPPWGTFFSLGEITSQKFSTGDRNLRGQFLKFTHYWCHGRRRGGTRPYFSGIPNSPDLVGCGEHRETPSDPRDTSRWPPISQISPFGAHFLALGAMSRDGTGREMRNRWGPHVQGTWSQHGDSCFPAGTPPVKHYSLLTANSGLIFLTLPTLGAMAQ
jgi:hypothetical protein